MKDKIESFLKKRVEYGKGEIKEIIEYGKGENKND